jgi:hypothetical protein
VNWNQELRGGHTQAAARATIIGSEDRRLVFAEDAAGGHIGRCAAASTPADSSRQTLMPRVVNTLNYKTIRTLGDGMHADGGGVVPESGPRGAGLGEPNFLAVPPRPH